MIERITKGTLIRLPSGNVVKVLRRERNEWLCEYTEGSKARGEVLFSSAYLRDYGRRV